MSEFTEEELANEVWYPLLRFEYYEYSNLGRVGSWKRGPWTETHGIRDERRILSRVVDKNTGYLGVRIAGKTRIVHRIICEAAHGPKPSPKHEVCHKDWSKLNNRTDNLEWGTHEKNMQDKIKSGNIGDVNKRLNINDIPRILKRYFKEGEFQRSMAKQFKVTNTNISHIICGRIHKNIFYKYMIENEHFECRQFINFLDNNPDFAEKYTTRLKLIAIMELNERQAQEFPG